MEQRDDRIEDPLDAQESLFIVEGLTEPASENSQEPQIVEMMLSAPTPEEESSPDAEMAPLTVNLADAEGSQLVGELASEFGGESEGENSETEEDSETEEAVIPPLYKWGSIAAGFMLLVVGGAIAWKKSQSVEEPLQIAKAPIAAPRAETVPETESPVSENAEPAASAVSEAEVATVLSVVPESESVAVAPEPVSVDMEPTQENPLVAAAEPVEPQPTVEEPAVRETLEPLEEAPFSRLRRGEGILQLRNGNLFPGRVMKISQKGVVLRVAEGDLVFPLDDVVQVLPAGSKDYEGYPHGFVELANGNRLWGRILDRGEETVTVASGVAKIVLKRDQVLNVKLGLGVGLVLP